MSPVFIRLSSTLSLMLLLAACAPQTLWRSGDITVKSTSDPSVHKIIQGDKELYYRVQDGMAFLDDHTLLGPVDESGVLTEFLETQGAGRSDCIFWIFCPEFRWPQGNVPYTISDDVSNWQRSQIKTAINTIHRTTRIQMIPKEDSHRDYIQFVPGRIKGACISYLGKKGGRQTIALSQNGCDASSVQHEIGHALGLLHEHQRCDRAEHIKIHWGEISLLTAFNFVNLCFMGKDFGEYDPTSIMQYDAYAFSKSGRPTITLISGELPHPSSRFSQGDLDTIEEIYAREFEKRN